MPKSYLETVLRARIYEYARQTELTEAPLLSARVKNRVWLKREDLQPVFSFKLRGAANKMLSLTEEERARGVVAASAGNHAQGVAMAAQRMDVRATIVMPRTTPGIKVEAVRNLGAKVVLTGDNYDEASAHAHKLVATSGATFIHPYDDPTVIAGQATVALEILRQSSEPPDVVFVPVGGGGLIAGVAAVVKAVYPETLVIGVEPRDAASMRAAMDAGERVALDEVGIFADGVAVRQIGAEPFRVCVQEGLVDDVVTVSTDEICGAIKLIFEDTRSIAEPAGALSVAGMRRWAADTGAEGLRMVAIVSGANMNFDRLRNVAERAEVGEEREVLLAVTIPERPGAFLEFCGALGKRQITEFNYRLAGGAEAHIFVGVETHGTRSERTELIASLADAGYAVHDLTDDELAKLHLRHMVGGRSLEAKGERLFRFIFPERPGALLKFLRTMRAPWNVSLFHYRNHGSAHGRVLVGVEVPEGDEARLESFLAKTGFPFVEETDNPAYRLFL
jgi:threonine dehydratase